MSDRDKAADDAPKPLNESEETQAMFEQGNRDAAAAHLRQYPDVETGDADEDTAKAAAEQVKADDQAAEQAQANDAEAANRREARVAAERGRTPQPEVQPSVADSAAVRRPAPARDSGGKE